MKIFLIYPVDTRYHRTSCPALSLAYLASSLIENGHIAKISDRNIILAKNRNNLPGADETTLKEIADFNPDIVVFSSTITTILDINYFSGIIKNIMPGKKTIIANPYPYVFYYFDPEYNLENCRHIDIAVHGESEQTIVKVINNLDNLSMVKGVTFRDGGKIISTGEKEPIMNLDEIPMPRRDLLNMKFYCAHAFDTGLYGRGTTVFSSRGCHNNCNYCLSYGIGPNAKPKARFHSANRVIAEIEDILSLCKIDYLYFYDDDFLFDKARVVELCENIIKKKLSRKINWIAQTRAQKSRIDESTLRLMKKSGCIQLEFGFESGSQEELNRMNKKIMVDEYFKIVELVKRVGLRIQSDFIVGYPGQTAKDLEKTISFIKKINPTYITTLRYMPLPGTQAYENLRNNGFKQLPGDLGQERNFTAMSDKELAKTLNATVIPLKIKNNRKNFIIYYLLNNPILLCCLTFKKILEFIYGTFFKEK